MAGDLIRPSVFVGSSSEGLEFARGVRDSQDQDAEVTMWNEGVFALGQTFVEGLTDALPRFDFAVLVLTPDDLVQSRSTEQHGRIDPALAFVSLILALAEAARYAPGGQPLKRVTIVVFKRDADTPPQVDSLIVRHALALVGLQA